MIRRGDVWWADLTDPAGSGPGFRRPVLVVQSDQFNRSAIGTVIVSAITSNISRAEAPGNLELDVGESGLPKPSVVNVSQLVTIDRRLLTERAGALGVRNMEVVDGGIRLALGP